MELPLHSDLSLYNARLIAGLLFSVHNVHYYLNDSILFSILLHDYYAIEFEFEDFD